MISTRPDDAVGVTVCDVAVNDPADGSLPSVWVATRLAEVLNLGNTNGVLSASVPLEIRSQIG